MSTRILALVWAGLMASSFVASARITEYASPLVTTGLRFGFALLLMTPIYCLTRSRRSFSLRESLYSVRFVLRYLLISGSLVGFFIGLFTALKTTTSLNTSVIYTLVPIIGALIASLFGQVTGFKQWFGYVLGAGGAIVVLLFTRDGSIEWHQGDAIYLLACCLLAFHVVAVQRWSAKVSAFEGAYLILLFASVSLLPMVLVFGELGSVQWLNLHFWKLLVYLTVFTTLITFILQQWVTVRAGAACLLGFSYTIPVWVAGYFALSYDDFSLLSSGFGLGLLMVILALLMIDGRFTRASRGTHGPTLS